MSELILFTVYGKCASKANGRIKTKYAGIIKSDAARQFCDDFAIQTPRVEAPIMCDVMLVGKIYYLTRRNDLDESLVMDCLEKNGIIGNDRQIKGKFILHGLDREKPRVVIALRTMDDSEDFKWRVE